MDFTMPETTPTPEPTPTPTPAPTPTPPVNNQAAIDAAVSAALAEERQKTTAAHQSALDAALATEKEKQAAIVVERDKLKAEAEKSRRTERMKDLDELLANASDTDYAQIMNAIKADDAQSLLLHSREQATAPLIKERDDGFASRDAIIAEQNVRLANYEFTEPMTRALLAQCGGMEHERTLSMALGEAATFWTTNEDGKRVPNLKGPTSGMHPTEDKPIDHEGVAIWLEQNVPAFAKSSSLALKGGDSEVNRRKAAEGSASERLKKAKTPEEKQAILKEMKEAAAKHKASRK